MNIDDDDDDDDDRPKFLYTMRLKKQDTLLMSITSQSINRFSKSFHTQKFLQCHYIPPYLDDVATLPYETLIFFENSINSKMHYRRT